MSTKNLARTIFEVGRTEFSKFERLQRNRRFRRKEKDLCRKLRHDPEEEGYLCPTFDHRHDHIDYADCLRPFHRWMEKHENQDWSEVVKAIATNFGSNKMKDWHFRDHVRMTMQYRYYIEGGKLKKRDSHPFLGRYQKDVAGPEVIEFLRGRKLFYRNGLESMEIPINEMSCADFYWRIPSHKLKYSPKFFLGKLSYCTQASDYFIRIPVQWDRREEMTPEEFEYFRCFSFEIRMKIMNHVTSAY